MRELDPGLPFVHDETALSWAARLAALHTRGRTRPFLADFEISAKDLATGAGDAIDRLCKIAGERVDIVRHNVIEFLGGRSRRLREEMFSSEFMTDPDTRFCPACLHDDDAAGGDRDVVRRHRLIWLLAPMRICPLHRLRLIDRRPSAWDAPFHELGVIVPEAQSDLGSLIDRAEQADPTALQAYILNRLEGRPGTPWLDDQSVEQAWRSTEFLGAVMAFGPSRACRQMCAKDWDEAARHGWEVVQGGADAVRDVLETLARTGRRKAYGVPHPRAAFGLLYAWLSATRQAKDPGPIVDLMRTCVRENFGLLPGQKLLGAHVERPAFCAMTALAKAEHVDARTLRNVAEGLGITPAKVFRTGNGSRDIRLYHYEQVRPVCEAIKRSVPLILLQDFLGASRPMIQHLIENGFIGLLAGHRHAESKMGRAADGLDVEAVKTLILSIPQSRPPTSDFVSLSKAAEKTRFGLDLIVPAVLGGMVAEVFRLPGKAGLNKLIVDCRELEGALMFASPGMSSEVAIRILGFPSSTVMGRIAFNSRSAPLMTRKIIDHQWVLPDAMARFRARYVLFGRLSSETGLSLDVMKETIKARHIEPAIDPSEAGVILFERSRLPRNWFL